MKILTMKKTILLILCMCVSSLVGSSLCFSESAAQMEPPFEGEKPQVLVISANYSLLLGYAFYIEHRGAKITGRKELYKNIEKEIINMRNPSDAMNFMYEFGYELIEVYSFPSIVDNELTVNYVFKRKS